MSLLYCLLLFLHVHNVANNIVNKRKDADNNDSVGRISGYSLSYCQCLPIICDVAC